MRSTSSDSSTTSAASGSVDVVLERGDDHRGRRRSCLAQRPRNARGSGPGVNARARRAARARGGDPGRAFGLGDRLHTAGRRRASARCSCMGAFPRAHRRSPRRRRPGAEATGALSAGTPAPNSAPFHAVDDEPTGKPAQRPRQLDCVADAERVGRRAEDPCGQRALRRRRSGGRSRGLRRPGQASTTTATSAPSHASTSRCRLLLALEHHDVPGDAAAHPLCDRKADPVVSPVWVPDPDHDSMGAHARSTSRRRKWHGAGDARVVVADGLLAGAAQIVVGRDARRPTRRRRSSSIARWFCDVGGTIFASRIVPSSSIS